MENKLIPYESEPRGPNVTYLFRISIWTGVDDRVDGFIGPFQMMYKSGKSSQPANDPKRKELIIPRIGPVVDNWSRGIFGFAKLEGVAMATYNLIKCCTIFHGGTGLFIKCFPRLIMI